MTFSEELKEARRLTGLTQQALAKRLLIPIRTYESWEMGEKIPAAYIQRLLLSELPSLNKQESTQKTISVVCRAEDAYDIYDQASGELLKTSNSLDDLLQWIGERASLLINFQNEI